MSTRYDPQHPGIVMAEKLLQQIPYEAAQQRVSEEAMALQERVNSGRDILEQSHIDRLKELEVARTYLRITDISNPMARHKLENVQKGLSPTGTALMSKTWQRLLDDKQKPTKDHDGLGTVTVRFKR